MTEEQMKALFLLAGIEIQDYYRLENQYWPDHENYDITRRNSPWWLVKTPVGLIKIGWRKNVIEIDWSDTKIALLIDDDVTKTESHCHAWGYSKALTYLATVAQQIRIRLDKIGA